MKLPLRRAVFWLHLAAGLLVGTVVFVMSVTGVLLMYERQITEWADRGYRSAPPSPGAPRLPVETLLGNVLAARPGAKPTSVLAQSDPAAPVAVSLGREATLYVNPYTGQALGEGSQGVRKVFRVATEWHRWLGTEGESRNRGRAVTGACNLAFLFLVVSGFYLWVPRRWSRPQVRNVTWFRRGLPGKARDFNWHNVIGFWMAVPLFLVVLSAVVLSYPWAGDLVYRVVGDEPPPRREGGEERGPAEGAAGRRRAWRWTASTSSGPSPSGGSPAGGASACGCRTRRTIPCRSRSRAATGAAPTCARSSPWTGRAARS